MKCRADVALGVAGGYFLGRGKKIKFALILTSVAAGLRSRKSRQHLMTGPLPGSMAPGSDDASRTETLTVGRPENTHPEQALPDDASDESEFARRATDSAPQLRPGGVGDVDGAEVSETEVVIFSLDGRQYRLDLPVQDAARLRDSLAPFVAAARPKGRNGRARRAGTGGRGSPGHLRPG